MHEAIVITFSIMSNYKAVCVCSSLIRDMPFNIDWHVLWYTLCLGIWCFCCLVWWITPLH